MTAESKRESEREQKTDGGWRWLVDIPVQEK